VKKAGHKLVIQRIDGIDQSFLALRVIAKMAEILDTMPVWMLKKV